MGLAAFMAGSLPLSFALSPNQLRLITACGTGVLVGTSLIVIIPEGIETLYSAAPQAQGHARRGLSVSSRNVYSSQHEIEHAYIATMQMRGAEEEVPVSEVHIRLAQEEGDMTRPDDGRPGPDDRENQDSPDDEEELPDSPPKQDTEEDAQPRSFEPHAWVGLSLITGFILMYLVDKLPQLASASSRPATSYISLERLTLHRTPSASHIMEGDGEPDQPVGHGGSRPSSTTIGLVIHAAADGIALGASSTSSSRDLGFIVFFALMIHKAPAAFGLTSVLLKQGLSKRRARAHLIIFSLAAPVGAFVTWAAANIIEGGSLSEGANTNFATGVLLLFSGGTFLYVAMHTMQDNSHVHETVNGSVQDGYADIYQQPAPKVVGPTLVDTLVTVCGMLLPLLTQVGHAH